MIQYIINTTAIWLISLVVYEILLRRESIHAFNRTYLLLALVAGIVHPLFVLELANTEVVKAYYTPVNYTVQQAAVMTESISYAATPSSQPFHWIELLQYTYITGVLIMLIFLLKEVHQLIVLYKKGEKRSLANGWVLVETGKEHGPFSIFRLLFVTGKDIYTEEELQVVMLHELRHYNLLHVVDLLLVQTAAVFFWFHPLVYLFRKRLLLVHEYQADIIQKSYADDYGRFLINQSLLHNAPSISHSFSRSPLKNRIMMLKKQSAKMVHIKAILVVPVMAATVLFFSNCRQVQQPVLNTYSMEVFRNGEHAMYKGNELGMKLRRPDTTEYTDAVTGQKKLDIGNWAEEPVTLNGKTIYNSGYKSRCPDTNPAFSVEGSTVGNYLFDNLKDDFAKLDDGEYNLAIGGYVIDENGELAYYDYSGFHRIGVNVDAAYMSEFDDKVKTVMYDIPKFNPATLNGQTVPAVMHGTFGNKFYKIVVKNHNASLVYTGKSDYI